MSNLEKRYEMAKDTFAAMGVDADSALKKMSDIPISIHCWQLDDLTGFEDFGAVLSGGIAATGNAPGKPRSVEDFFHHLDAALAVVPGEKNVAIHAVYRDGSVQVERNRLLPEHFNDWIDYAREKKIGLDFNPTYFSHPMAKSNYTLASAHPAVRRFWVEHGIASRKISEHIGRELGRKCINNHWIPDGGKDITVDKLAPRLRLIESLDEILAADVDQDFCVDSLESKLFGLGLESYTVGSHEFYSNYVLTGGNAIVCMDVGHFHPTETVSSKITSYLAFNRELMLHVSRPVRWDSDHVVILDEETKAIMEEIARNDAFDRVHVGTDYFDASINRVAAMAIGGRSTKKAILYALLQPHEQLKKLEAEGDYTRRLILLEEIKTLPFGYVWDMFCFMNSVPAADWGDKLLSGGGW